MIIWSLKPFFYFCFTKLKKHLRKSRRWKNREKRKGSQGSLPKWKCFQGWQLLYAGFVAMFFVRSIIQSYAWQIDGLSIYNRTLTLQTLSVWIFFFTYRKLKEQRKKTQQQNIKRKEKEKALNKLVPAMKWHHLHNAYFHLHHKWRDEEERIEEKNGKKKRHGAPLSIFVVWEKSWWTRIKTSKTRCRFI